MVEYWSPKPWVVGSSPSAPAKKKAIRESEWLFSTMCSACAERDVPFGRDVCFASDVRFAREDAEHITKTFNNALSDEARDIPSAKFHALF